jgi:tetratricopeptide (TPR) repeat protein
MTVAEDIVKAREQQLDEVLADYLKAVQEGRAPSRQALLDSHPDLASELADFFADQDHVERLASPLRALTPTPPLPAGALLGDYELIDAIAQGGMGIVYRARQKSLQRFVAVKVLLAGALASPEQVQRFRTEAESIASLDHANIVPIYEVGVYDNRPYFSMKLLEGGSLADRLLSEARPTPRQAAALLATVADAVHFAHERGILHRDLKPANILLDAQGQPHVSDFGLAKRAGRTAETPVLHAALTVSGAIVGTPSYMAPEQAAGARGITTAADVYGLGAILYELLTGRPPFRGDDLFDTLRRLRDEEPAAPRTLNPRLDRDVDTICLKCLQKEPARRYVGARELAVDLRRYLAGEPIEARPIGRLERCWRWCRRKPVAAAVMLAFVAVIVTAFVVVEMARRRAVRSESDKEEERRAFAAGRDKARRMIDELCLELSAEGWGEDPAVAAKRKRMLEKSIAYYRDFLDDPDSDAPARDELLRDYFRIAELSAALGDRARALNAFQRARFAAETLLQLRPEDRNVVLELARSHNRIGMLCQDAGRRADAVASCRAAHDLLADQSRRRPDDLAVDGELAVSCNMLGNLYSGMGRSEVAQASYRECINLNRELRRRSSDSQYSYALAVALGNLSALVYKSGEKKEGRELSEEANRLLRGLDAKVPRYRQELARHLLNRAIRLGVEKRHAEAVKALLEGRDVLIHLVDF